MGSISEQLTSCLTSFDSEALLTLKLTTNLLCHLIQSRKTGGATKSFFKWPTLASFSFIFGLFKQTSITIFTTNQCEKMSCTSRIRCQASNPQPLEHESLPITTKPGLSPTTESLSSHTNFLESKIQSCLMSNGKKVGDRSTYSQPRGEIMIKQVVMSKYESSCK